MDAANVMEEKHMLVEEERVVGSVAKGCRLSTGRELAQHCGRETCFSTGIFSGLPLFASLTSACGCFSYSFSFGGRNAVECVFAPCFPGTEPYPMGCRSPHPPWPVLRGEGKGGTGRRGQWRRKKAKHI